jgi:hypothetical protein
MLLTIGVLLVLLWALCVLLFKLHATLIHALLVIGVIAVVAHFVRRRAPPPPSAG